MEATLHRLEGGSGAGEPGSPTDATMQEAATPPETPSKALGYQLANAGLDSAKGVCPPFKLVIGSKVSNFPYCHVKALKIDSGCNIRRVEWS